MVAPCCFDKPSDANKLFASTNEDETVSDYVQGHGKQLGIGRLGLVHPQLQAVFLNSTGDKGVLKPSSDCFLRMGIPQSSNSFFSLMASYRGSDYDAQDVQNHILQNMTIQEFQTLNKGAVEIEFRTNTMQLFSPFQNFLEYTMSDNVKNYRYYWDYLTRPMRQLITKADIDGTTFFNFLGASLVLLENALQKRVKRNFT